MNAIANTDIAVAYSERFDNYAEVAHPAIFDDPRFGQLMQQAIDRAQPLARSEVESVFGDLAYDQE